MVSSITFKAMAFALSIVPFTNAHMIMRTPTPYAKGTINSSPLLQDGSDFPCKGLFNLASPNDVNYLVPGQPNKLSFIGGATHGGGSCQVALTPDLGNGVHPQKDTLWTVIKSIEGSCPSDAAGNLSGNPEDTGASTFEYTVPVGYPEGKYHIAWTWFNKIGNREMYMNCGSAVIQNSKKRYAAPEPKPALEYRATNYPDIFRAQLDIFSQCKVPEGINVAFPSPGSDVQVLAAVSPPTGNCGVSSNAASAGGSASGSGSSSQSAPAAAVTSSATANAGSASASAAVQQPSASANASGKQSVSTALVFAGGASSQTLSPLAPSSAAATASATMAPNSAAPAPAASAPAASAPAASAPAASAPAAAAATSGSSPPASGSNAAGSPCSQEGEWSCGSDGKSFQRCASGMWSASMSVAAGTVCTPGQSMDFHINVVASGTRKRDSSLIDHLVTHRRNQRLAV